MTEADGLRPLYWVGSSKRDFDAMPEDVTDEMGFALYVAQKGSKHDHAKPLKGFGGAGVLEVVSDHRDGTFRCVYTVRFPEAVYVLHAFQKKSKRGIETPRADLDIVTRRQKLLEQSRSEEKP